jgi:hypothetical protein
MNLVSKDFISKELLNDFENDKNIFEKFNIIYWDTIPSIYLKFKTNEAGFILSLIPFLNSDSMGYHLTIMLVDSQKNPKTLDWKFVKCETKNIDFIKKYIISLVCC